MDRVECSLPSIAAPCLAGKLLSLLDLLSTSFPPAAAYMAAFTGVGEIIDPSQDPLHGLDPLYPATWQFILSTQVQAYELHASRVQAAMPLPLSLLNCPRLLLCGKKGDEQYFLRRALVDAMRGTPVFQLGQMALRSADGGQSIEEKLVSRVQQAYR